VLFSQLDDFRRCYPHIDLQLSTHNNRVDPAAEGLDYTIRYGGGRGTARRRRFFALHRWLRFARLTLPPATHPADILKFTLRSYRRDEWSAWMQAAGEHPRHRRIG
jgi:LysR family transcriptional regulator of beta-lactamase